MKTRFIAGVLLLGLLVSLTGCSPDRIDRAKVTREGSFNLQEALSLQQATYAPVYEFIMGAYPEEGPSDERFDTREKVADFLAETFSEHEAERIADAFFDKEGNRRWDTFLPTIFHDGVTIVDAYFERVTFRHSSELYLVIEEEYDDGTGDGDTPKRKTLYQQDLSGEWKYRITNGLQSISGPSISAHGRR